MFSQRSPLPLIPVKLEKVLVSCKTFLSALQSHHGFCEQIQREVTPEEKTERHVLVALQ